MSFDFINAFYEKVKERKIDWEVKGLLGSNDLIFTLGSDSKLIGRIFELISAPIIKEIAQENGYVVQVSKSQTVYPDFTLHKEDEYQNMIAVDIKTTYRRSPGAKIGYTLGSFASFLRNGTKNIAFPYTCYSNHYVVGFVYDRNPNAQEDVVEIDKIDTIAAPYSNVQFFVQEKHKIAGDKPGSGNTENIGSFATNDIEMLRQGKGPFSVLGKEVFEHYWKNYPKYRETNPNFTDLPGYFKWLKQEGHEFAKKEELYKKWLDEFGN